jgi:hypothetical protein
MATGDVPMGRVVLNVVVVCVIMFVTAFLVYGAFSAATGLQPPEGVSPARFLFGVVVTKIGHALAFVLLFYLALQVFLRHWVLYAFIWWCMFALSEVGEAICFAEYSWTEAILGIVAEAVYFPLAALATKCLLGRTCQAPA